jgi:hypothetical protein
MKPHSPNDKWCSGCLYFGAEERHNDGTPWQKAGECRRYPPRVAASRGNSSGSSPSEFPIANHDDWCGEWQPYPGLTSVSGISMETVLAGTY